jgi:endogenous inhibitor of DNA gyrase (YacG/DUF329 family)
VTALATIRCPICEREFDPATEGAVKPFCSERCRTIDLGRWLGESYSLPAEQPADPDADEGEGESPSPR